MNPSQEKYVFDAFRELYPEFPIGQAIQGDKPDYIINADGKKIGVEITQIFIDNQNSSSLNVKRMESLNSMLGNRLCQAIIPIIPFKFILSIDFSKKSFSINDISRIVAACQTFLEQESFVVPENESIDFENYGQLPREINEIQLFNTSTQDESMFSESAGGAVPDLTNDHLQVVLVKKDKVMNQYSPCDEYWLLIEEGTFRSDSFGDILADTFTTNFDKVFLYRHSKGQVVSLK